MGDQGIGSSSTKFVIGNHMLERLESAKAITDKESQHHQKTLTESKGRAQVTATTAMSIVNVALLKSVLDRGPENNRYFMVSLVLISISLGLQIVAGIMSLMIEQAHGYMSKYGGNFCEDIQEYCCIFRCITNKRRPRRNKEVIHEDGRHSPRSTERTSLRMLDEALCDVESDTGTVLADAAEDPLCECCPYVLTNKIYAEHEISTLEKFNKWRMNFVDNELKKIKTEDELVYQVGVVENANEKLAALTEMMKKPDANKTEIEQQIEQLKEQITNAQNRKNYYEKTLAKVETAREQGNVLKEYVGAIKKNRLLRMAAFWQQILNYLFYLIFIINAFITGFGLGSSPDAPTGPVMADNVTHKLL